MGCLLINSRFVSFISSYSIFNFLFIDNLIKFLFFAYFLLLNFYFYSTHICFISSFILFYSLVIYFISSLIAISFLHSYLILYILLLTASVQTHQTMIIEETEPDVFRQLIEYIHTGCVTLQARTLLGTHSYSSDHDIFYLYAHFLCACTYMQ